MLKQIISKSDGFDNTWYHNSCKQLEKIENQVQIDLYIYKQNDDTDGSEIDLEMKASKFALLPDELNDDIGQQNQIVPTSIKQLFNRLAK